jgi:hypothetical protein
MKIGEFKDKELKRKNERLIPSQMAFKATMIMPLNIETYKPA